MRRVACGVDFGTTNSSIAVNLDGQVQVVPVDNGRSFLKSHVFLHRDPDWGCGDGAIRRFLNEGHYKTRCIGCERGATRLTRTRSAVRWLPHGCEQYRPGWYCSDARLLCGIKAEVSDLHFTRTTSWGLEYRLEWLVAVVVGELKRQAERWVGMPINKVVFGLPVVFGQNDDWEALEGRLNLAAQEAGFEEFAVCWEPVAGALEPTDGAAQGLILSLDFGGGTFDVAVLRVHDDAGQLNPEFLGLGGADVGGDRIDGLLFDRYFAEYFGLTLSEREVGRPLPHQLRRDIQTRFGLARLATENPAVQSLVMELVARREETVSRPMQRLADLLYGGQAFRLYEAIEQAKCDLSRRPTARIQFRGGSIAIDQAIHREDLDSLLAGLLPATDAAIGDALVQAGCELADIDTVLLTGGSSRLTAFQNHIHKLLPDARVVANDAYTSVASGLAAVAFNPSFFGDA